MQELARTYIDGRRKRGEITYGTWQRHGYCLEGFCTTFGRRPPANLSTTDIDRWLETIAQHRPSTRRLQQSQVRCFVAWLIERGTIRNPKLLTAFRPVRQPRCQPRALPAHDVAAVLDCPDARLAAILALMIWTGLRCIEVARLNVEDWDRRSKTMIVVGKGSHERRLPVPEQVEQALVAYLATRPATVGPLFRNRYSDGKGITAKHVGALVGQHMSDVGVKLHAYDGVSAHAARHTAASDTLDASGGDVRLVQELLGHESLETTQVYLRRASVGAIADVLARRSYPKAA